MNITKIQPQVSIVVPIHNMKDGDKFLWRLVNSLTEQTFKDWELIITKEGKMAENTNAGIKRARGKFIKILYLDDYFTDKYVLENIVDSFKESNEAWMICGTNNNQEPYWTDDILSGNNHLGSPSALTLRVTELFDEKMSWLLDVDLYSRLYKEFGPPKIIKGDFITIGVGDHQMTHILTQEQKQKEHNYLQEKYG